MSEPTMDPREEVIRATLREHHIEYVDANGVRWCACEQYFGNMMAHRRHVAREIVRALDERPA